MIFLFHILTLHRGCTQHLSNEPQTSDVCLPHYDAHGIKLCNIIKFCFDFYSLRERKKERKRERERERERNGKHLY